jgi:DeoR family transcriptional regulator of aga operon/DeoR family fructose operon transcriptional repressor
MADVPGEAGADDPERRLVTGSEAGTLDRAYGRERRSEILRVLETQGRVRVSDLAGRFGVSAVTIRKDLDRLAEDGRLVRAHGGAIAPRSSKEPAFDLRARMRREEKSAIGALAAALVADGESVILDASTTALHVARHLLTRQDWHTLTVLTNGIRIAEELASQPAVTVLLMGGRVRWESFSVVGQLGDAVFERVNVQKAFLGAVGFTLEEGLTEAQEEQAQIKRAMVAAAREVYAIVDHSKWGRVGSATFCRADDLVGAITDASAPAEMCRGLTDMGVEVIRPGSRTAAPA